MECCSVDSDDKQTDILRWLSCIYMTTLTMISVSLPLSLSALTLLFVFVLCFLALDRECLSGLLACHTYFRRSRRGKK